MERVDDTSVYLNKEKDMSAEFDDYASPKRWDEFEWEKFMKERDEEADKIARFMEEHKDDPDLDSLLAREMGWFMDDTKGVDKTTDSNFDDVDDEGEEWKSAAGIRSEDYSGSLLPDFRSDPVYRKAFDFAIDSVALLDGLAEDLQTDSMIQDAFSLALMPAAKVANAWDDGSDNPDLLGYRIAAYKRGLAAANKSLELMGNIRRRRLVDDHHLLALINLGTEVRNDIAIRILEVRQRFNEG